ncbi:MAG: AAA family ATPase [Alphaproteobacteria bacterium]|nr:AAA family ATPase [Alphaproteobacteria bacterium]
MREKQNFHILTGCSGGGKSTLLTALQQRGILCVSEAGRDIVRRQEMIGGEAVPWKNGALLGEMILTHNIHNFESVAEEARPVIFDRGIPEAVSYCSPPALHHLKAAALCRYNKRVFVVPPWQEIFVQDAERKRSFDDAVREYHAQNEAYIASGYTLLEIPKLDVDRRADFIMARLEGDC